jgi:hypothetical protein
MEGGDEPTTRGDFPGGFAGDKRNAFAAGGRMKDEQELVQFIRRLTTLRRELEPLRNGALVNLYVAEQQYAYARMTRDDAVVVVFNNDDKPAEIEFDLPRSRFQVWKTLYDRLGEGSAVNVIGGKLRATLPRRSVAIYARTMPLDNHVK